MQHEDFEISAGAEQWVKDAFLVNAKVGGGSYSIVLESTVPGHVVKLTRSHEDFLALCHFSGTGEHFPRVTRSAMDQGRAYGNAVFAIEMERLPEQSPVSVQRLADEINRCMVGKRHFASLRRGAAVILAGEMSEYPETLAHALLSLADFAFAHGCDVEMNQSSNWGRRVDGTLVMLDLAHKRGAL